jgi:hypothetical protein
LVVKNRIRPVSGAGCNRDQYAYPRQLAVAPATAAAVHRCRAISDA